MSTAKVILDTAIKIAPDYIPAKEGMAAYWLAVGDKAKAKKALEGTLMPAFYKNIKKTGDDTSDKKAPQVAAKIFMPEKPKKVLWKGEYKLSE